MANSLFTVMVPVDVTEQVCIDGWQHPRVPQSHLITYTRQGRIFSHVESAKRLAKRHLGRVIDLNSRQVVIDYLPC